MHFSEDPKKCGCFLRQHQLTNKKINLHLNKLPLQLLLRIYGINTNFGTNLFILFCACKKTHYFQVFDKKASKTRLSKFSHSRSLRIVVD